MFRAWTFRVASREAFRHLRKRRVWMGKHDDDPQLENLPGPEVRPVGELLQQLLAADVVSPASRAVLMLHFQEELSLPETAAILDIPLGTAKSRRAYGLAAIRRHVAGLQSKIRPTNGPAVLRTVEAHMATIREKRCTARSTRLMPIANA